MEKFQTFRHGKAMLFCAAFLGLMVFVFMACRQDKELPLLENKIESKAVLKDAQKWFEDYQSKGLVSDKPKYRLLQPQ